MIDISVVIPYYNESSTIKTTLELIKDQTYKPKEVIFINSSSTDDSSEIIDLWIGGQSANNKVKYLNINSNSATPSSSKNLGINNSNYEWIAFMDCGLIFSKNWLKVLVAQLQRHDFKPGIVSGVCKLYGYTSFDMCAVAHTYGVGTNRVCIPGSIVNRAVFDRTGLFLDNMRASYDRAWQKKTRDKNIYRITPDINNVSYIGINFSKSTVDLFKKIVLYSKPAVNVKKYYTPFVYIFFAILLVLVFISSVIYGAVIFLWYAIMRGYFLPLYKSNDRILILKSIKSILLLPFVGMVIDIARLYGYLLGYMDRLFDNSNN